MLRPCAALTMLVLLAAWRPSLVWAEEPPAQSPDAGQPSPSTEGHLEREVAPIGRVVPVKPSGPACTSSTECAKKLGYGEVCVAAGHCQEYVDETDIFTMLHMSKSGHITPEPFVLYPSIVPAIGYNPALGFLIGVTAFLNMYLGDPETTTISSAQPVFLYTSLNQIVIQLVTTLMTADNGWELQGDYRFLIYNQDTYGLGSGVTPVSGGITIGGYGQTAAVPG
ncbi:MAG TPA: hypothetical protein VK454_05590, partial [Myxococcaceae bacterium]|nr:hypothetical protein [Myxococcaceae bacterium]